MNRSRIARRTLIVAALAALCAGTGGCFGGGNSDSTVPARTVGILLPTRPPPSGRVALDRALLERRLRARDVPVIFASAPADPAARRRAARRLIDGGARVLVLVNTDSQSGAGAEALAHARGAKVVDYDRLTLRGAADYLVGYDVVQAGELMGAKLADCLDAAGVDHPRIAELNGPPADDEATMLKQGYDSVLNPYFTQEKARKVADLSAAQWNGPAASREAAGLVARAGGRIDAVMAGGDGLAAAAIAELRRAGVGSAQVAGQGATAQGLTAVRSGEQCVTVRRAASKETVALAELVTSLAREQKPSDAGQSSYDTERKVPSVLLDPEAVTAKDLR